MVNTKNSDGGTGKQPRTGSGWAVGRGWSETKLKGQKYPPGAYLCCSVLSEWFWFRWCCSEIEAFVIVEAADT
ncbi:hypothetical protein glysoja_031485 [Glycine soja]|uniref:Uncharacterized protein n=1 Tax=Glycine soja TaxID=3848 RepID=A0A0B2SMD1_GLYSO|nr:hypothetical protein glysoja_031485 [Glycine soja]